MERFVVMDRISIAEETWNRIQPAIQKVGVTRVADITWLDEVGIPCAQAIRPNSRTVSVAQGKGSTLLLAFISAAMEAIEAWHAERVDDPCLVASMREVDGTVRYPVSALRLTKRSYLNSGTRLEWTSAAEILTARETLVPTASLRLDSRVDEMWEPILFDVTSNGLSSGITRNDAILHGLLEVIERDALARVAEESTVNVLTDDLPETAAGLVRQFKKANVDLEIEALKSPTGIPCFRVRAFSEDFMADFCGSAADADPGTALCRALTEAAQSRLAAIAGTREDFSCLLYEQDPDTKIGERRTMPAFAPLRVEAVDLPRDSDRAVAELASRVRGMTGHQPMVVDHTRPEIGVPVVRVICPGMLCPNDY
ncbi:YcaO-like family protein [Streptomyces sp. NBC_00829]|uniref:YcaO-like family protein n=1 Tax=Streptomyces sp. NBC_00829 TaxID=2903679 RepID=UPI003864BFD7|nr:YcaO-like family protein [Streptomyces sp. NBC_00829]